MNNHDQRPVAFASFEASLLRGLIVAALRLSRELPAGLLSACFALRQKATDQLLPLFPAIVPF